MNNEQQNPQLQAEFDAIADDYYRQHKENLAITGEGPEYFAEYKVADLAAWVRGQGLVARDILDFGCGIGNSIEHFRKYFPQSALCCADVSMRSIEIAKTRFPGNESFITIGESIPLASASQDVVFTACVFHHIPHEQHASWLAELNRITRPGGVLAVYEHNPLNPLTVHAVNTCPIDANAVLIRAGTMKRRVADAGWGDPSIRYKLFFPSILKSFRPLEAYLSRFFLGAQWRLLARKKG